MRTERGRRSVTGGYLGLLIGVFALAFNLRASITSLPPIFLDLEHRIGISASTVEVLAAIPLLAFGLCTVLAAPAARRLGEERVLAVATLVLAVGLLARGAMPHLLLLPGTAVATGGISMMNVLLSSLIKRRYPDRAGFLLGLYLTALYLGSIAGSALAVPVLHGTNSIRLSLSLWAGTALLAFLLWIPQLRRPRLVPAPVIHLPIYKSALAWQVASFMGLQSLTYYGTVSWLPTMLRERGLSAGHAGLLSAVLSLGGLITAFGVPVVAHRRSDHRSLVVSSVALCVGATVGTFLAPLGAVPFFILALGLGQGATLSLALYFFIARSPSAGASASLSAMSQGFGYLLAATGPLIIGFAHAASGSWTISMFILIAFLVALGATGLLAGRPRTLPLASMTE